jgi:pimeloyl-ACP methyl ester carboxylesterase
MKRNALRVVALLSATVMAVVAWVLAAALTSGFVLLAGVALGSFLLFGYVFLGLTDPDRDGAARKRKLVWLAAGALVYMGAAHLAVGQAPDPVMEELRAVGPIGTWEVADGIELAYLHTPPATAGPGVPVVMIHGGPGIPALPPMEETGVRPLDFLADRGHPVYYYDQRGSGFSGRHDLRRDAPYTVVDHVADLEAIREHLGVDRIVLVGHGWGATLAVQYLLSHPERVERLVALSPAPLWYPAFDEMVDPAARARLSEVQASTLALLERPPLRLVIGRLTAGTSRAAAHSLVEDWEADQWWTRATAEAWRLGQPNMTCSPDPARGLPPLAGLGFFSHSYTLVDALRLPDPRPALDGLDTPTLIVRGLCDYIRWEVAYEYLQVMPGARYVSLPAGGHLIWLEQQELLERVMVPFLADEVVPLSYYHPARARSDTGDR